MGGWGGGLQPPNNLLKFVDVTSEKVAKANVIEMKIETHMYSRKRPEYIKNTI